MKIYPQDWLFNAGILGFLRISEKLGRRYDLAHGYLEIEPKYLRNFSDAYFTHAAAWNMKASLQLPSEVSQKILKIDRTKAFKLFREIDSTGKKTINKIENKLNYKSADASIASVKSELMQYQRLITLEVDKYLVRNGMDRKQRVNVELKIKESLAKVSKKLDKKGSFLVLKLQRFYFNKDIVGNWVFKGRSREEAFDRKYVSTAKAILENKQEPNGPLCKFCKQIHVNSGDYNDSLFNEGMFSPTGVSSNKFANFFYNLQPDLFVCDLCELLLLCAWAGLTEIPYRFRDKEVNDTEFVFVNLPSLQLLKDANKRIQDIYKLNEEDTQGIIYDVVMQDLLLKEKRLKSSWVVNNVLFIEIKPTARKDQGKSKFYYFHMAKDIAELFIDDTAIKSFKNLSGKVTLNYGLDVPVRRDVVRRVLNHEPLYVLCNNITSNHLERQDVRNLRNVFNIAILSGIRVSKIMELGGDKSLESKQVYAILKNFHENGSNFSNLDFEERKRKSYHLLAMIRNSKVNDFYDAVVKLYITNGLPIPDSLLGILNKEDPLEFRAKAYAFISGFLGGNKKDLRTKESMK